MLKQCKYFYLFSEDPQIIHSITIVTGRISRFRRLAPHLGCMDGDAFTSCCTYWSAFEKLCNSEKKSVTFSLNKMNKVIQIRKVICNFSPSSVGILKQKLNICCCLNWEKWNFPSSKFPICFSHYLQLSISVLEETQTAQNVQKSNLYKQSKV